MSSESSIFIENCFISELHDGMIFEFLDKGHKEMDLKPLTIVLWSGEHYECKCKDHVSSYVGKIEFTNKKQYEKAKKALIALETAIFEDS